MCSLAILNNEPTIFDDVLNEPASWLILWCQMALRFGFMQVHPLQLAMALIMEQSGLWIKRQENSVNNKKEMLTEFSKIVMHDLELQLHTLR